MCLGEGSSPIPQGYHVELLSTLDHASSIDERSDRGAAYATSALRSCSYGGGLPLPSSAKLTAKNSAPLEEAKA